MNETHDTPQRIAALLAWYREMGVSAVLQDVPVDWRARGDVAPGAGYAMPAGRVVLAAGANGGANARSAAAAVQPARRDPLPVDGSGLGPALAARPPAAPRPSLSLRPAERSNANVRSFDKTGASPTGGVAVKIKAATLAALADELAAFEGCALKATAKSLCLFRGAEKARVMVIGEAPGREEDLAGEPFAGPSGQLLDKMLAAISLGIGDVHMSNLVYWRPPGNRKPTAQETAACAPFVVRHIELVAPDVVVLLGDACARQMLGTSDGIMKVRGKWREIEIGGRKIKAIATLDPAYVLRAAASKRQVWRDLLAIKAVL